jgi:hypothetical protein
VDAPKKGSPSPFIIERRKCLSDKGAGIELKHRVFFKELVNLIHQSLWCIACYDFPVNEGVHGLGTFTAIPETAVFDDIEIRVPLQYFKRCLRTTRKIADTKFDYWFQRDHLTAVMLPFFNLNVNHSPLIELV